MIIALSNEAAKDLTEIWLFTYKNWSVEQADRYYNLIMDEIDFLAKNPLSGKDYSQFRKGYYRTSVKSHFIFYRINARKNQVEIIRILHQRMDTDVILDK